MSATATDTVSTTASTRPARAAKTAALAAIREMSASTRVRRAPIARPRLEPMVINAPVAVAKPSTATATAQDLAKVPNAPYIRTLKREYFFPRPDTYTTSPEFTQRLQKILPFGRRLFENIDWYRVEGPSEWNRGAIVLQGTWWLPSDDMEEYSWTIEIRRSKKEYRMLLIANLYTNDNNEFYREFWREMSQEYIPRLHDFITKMTKALSNFV